jgi:rRNA pseudouridine-1189 N-methylase Emg1 (Nep1/Mra1 family)
MVKEKTMMKKLRILCYVEKPPHNIVLDRIIAANHSAIIARHFLANYKTYMELTEILGRPYTIATNRETLLNVIGCAIMNNMIDHNDVEVMVFTEDGERIEPHYDEEGYLRNWVFGFFDWNNNEIENYK